MRNLRLLYGIAFFSEAVTACVAYLFPLTRKFGGNENTVLWLQLEFIVLLAILQLPTGRFADSKGYKHSIVLGLLVILTGSCLYLLGASLWMFFLAEGIWALGSGLIQGADASLLRATLDREGRSEDFQSLHGRLAALRTCSRIGYFCLGGYLVQISLYAPFALSAVFLGAALALSLLLEDLKGSPRKARAAPRPALRICLEYLDPFSFTGRVLIAQAIIMAGTYLGFWLSTPWMESLDVSHARIGLYLAMLAALVAVSQMLASRWRLEYQSLKPYILLLVLTAGGFFLLGTNIVIAGIVGLAVQKIAFGFTGVIVDKQLLDTAEPDERATILSIAGMLRNSCMAFMLIASISMRDFTTLSERAGYLGVMIAGFSLLALICYRPVSRALESKS